MLSKEENELLIRVGPGVPMGELIPLRQRMFVPTEAALAAFADAPRVALERFRKDMDALINQDPTPRG